MLTIESGKSLDRRPQKKYSYNFDFAFFNSHFLHFIACGFYPFVLINQTWMIDIKD